MTLSLRRSDTNTPLHPLAVDGTYKSVGDLYRLDPLTLQWEELGSRMSGQAPSARYWAACTTAHGLFFMFGGVQSIEEERTGAR